MPAAQSLQALKKGVVIIMKKGFNKLIIAMLVLAAGSLLTGCGFHYVSGWGTNFLDRDDAIEFNVEKSVVSPITSITIDTRIADVELIEAEDYYVEINYLYWEEEPEYRIEGGKLYFDDRNAFPDSYSINFNLNNTIKIYLPKASALEDLDIQDSSGDVSIASFVAEDLNVTVSYGDLVVKDAAAVEANITLSSGTSKISDFQAGELNFTNSYGNAKFTNINTGDAFLSSETTYNKVDISMSSGDVTINGMQVESIKIDNSYGDIDCEEVTAKEFNMDLSSGNLDVKDSVLEEVDVNNSYGNVTLRLSGSEANYSLDLNTSYGDITVGNKDYDEHLVLDNGGTRSITTDLSSGDIEVTFQ